MSLLVLLLFHFLKPLRRAHTDCGMRHHCVPTRTMPMHFPCGDVHDVAHLKNLRFLASRTYQSLPHRDGQDLPEFVMMPERPRAGREANIVGHAVKAWRGVICGRLEDRVHVHCSCECFARLAGGSVGRMGATDELHAGELSQNRRGNCWFRVLGF